MSPSRTKLRRATPGLHAAAKTSVNFLPPTDARLSAPENSLQSLWQPHSQLCSVQLHWSTLTATFACRCSCENSAHLPVVFGGRDVLNTDVAVAQITVAEVAVAQVAAAQVAVREVQALQIRTAQEGRALQSGRQSGASKAGTN